MDANRLIDPPASPASTALQAPAVWQALALIALYFVLQLAIGSLVSLAAGLYQVLRDGGALAEVVAQGRHWLGRPDATALTVIVTLLVSAGVIVHITGRRWPRLWPEGAVPGLGFAPARRWAFGFAALAIGLMMPFVGGALTEWLARGHMVSQDIKQLGANTSLMLRIPLAIVVTTMGPLVEELLFRGVLLSAVSRRVGSAGAIVITALLFAVVHLPDLSFLWYAVPNLVLLGLALGWLRVQSASIWPAVLAHGLNNALAVVSWFVMAHAA